MSAIYESDSDEHDTPPSSAVSEAEEGAFVSPPRSARHPQELAFVEPLIDDSSETADYPDPPLSAVCYCPSLRETSLTTGQSNTARSHRDGEDRRCSVRRDGGSRPNQRAAFS
jgi:hypothetical protein